MQTEPSKAEIAAFNADVEALCKILLDGVPKHLRALIPTEMSARQQIAWYHNAETSGVFDNPAVPVTDGGARPAITPKAPDPSSLPVYARLAAAYSK